MVNGFAEHLHYLLTKYIIKTGHEPHLARALCPGVKNARRHPRSEFVKSVECAASLIADHGIKSKPIAKTASG
jgi:hypothetical protein